MIKQSLRAHATAWIYSLLLAAFAWSLPSASWAKKKYTKAQLKGIIKKARAAEQEKALKRNKKLKELKKKRKKAKRTLEVGQCRTKKKRKKTKTICVKLRKGKLAIYINGKYKPVLSALDRAKRKIAEELKSSMKKLKTKLKKLNEEIKKLGKKIKAEAGKAFDKAIAKLKREAKKVAKKLAKTKAWKKKIAKKLAKLAKARSAKAWSMLRGKMRTKLLDVLRNKRDYKAVRNAMYAQKGGAKALSAYGKSALTSIGMAVGFTSCSIAIACWKYNQAPKRSCLKRETNKGVKQLSFSIIAALVSLAVDLQVIEPLSHTFAGAVSAGLAAATAGAGAAAYPIVYVISSVTLNLAVYAALELAVRKEYERRIYPGMQGKVSQFSAGLIGGIPNKAMRCWGPKKYCAN